MTHHLSLPLSKKTLLPLRAGDAIYLSGPLYTARDAAHIRLAAAVAAGTGLPLDLQDVTIFYTGPCPPKPGEPIGSLGPTTSQRMDPFVEMMFLQGMSAMIGKGDRSPHISTLCLTYGGVYFLGLGGAAALTASQVRHSTVVAYEDLGTEAIRRLEVENMLVFVGIDTLGQSLSEQEISKYRRTHL